MRLVKSSLATDLQDQGARKRSLFGLSRVFGRVDSCLWQGSSSGRMLLGSLGMTDPKYRYQGFRRSRWM